MNFSSIRPLMVIQDGFAKGVKWAKKGVKNNNLGPKEMLQKQVLLTIESY